MKKIDEFYNTVKKIRKDCPWDRKQTHKSLEKYFIEEVYEFIEAVENEDFEEMKEELGDVLLQIMLHSVIAEENKKFTLEDVIDGINSKIIRRHPHVFTDNKLQTAEEVEDQWQKIKKEEGKKKKRSFHKPALILAKEIQKNVSQEGFDWDTLNGVYDKIKEELEELKKAKDKYEIEEELGDLLFVIVHLANWLDVDPEIALFKAIKKFLNRYEKTKLLIYKDNKKMKEMSVKELDEYWERAKKDIN